MHKLTH